MPAMRFPRIKTSAANAGPPLPSQTDPPSRSITAFGMLPPAMSHSLKQYTLCLATERLLHSDVFNPMSDLRLARSVHILERAALSALHTCP
jgi:hypothetical protein